MTQSTLRHVDINTDSASRTSLREFNANVAAVQSMVKFTGRLQEVQTDTKHLDRPSHILCDHTPGQAPVGNLVVGIVDSCLWGLECSAPMCVTVFLCATLRGLSYTQSKHRHPMLAKNDNDRSGS